MSQKQTRHKKQHIPGRAEAPPREVAIALKHIGLFSRIAARHEWALSHVLQVARGKRQSKPVIDAIVAEVRRIEEEQEDAA